MLLNMLIGQPLDVACPVAFNHHWHTSWHRDFHLQLQSISRPFCMLLTASAVPLAKQQLPLMTKACRLFHTVMRACLQGADCHLQCVAGRFPICNPKTEPRLQGHHHLREDADRENVWQGADGCRACQASQSAPVPCPWATAVD